MALSDNSVKVTNKIQTSIANLQATNSEIDATLKEIEDMKDHQKDLCLRCGGLTHQQYNQDQIDFAVAELIKFKKTLIKFLQDEGFYENEWYDLFDKIDQQIKELKEDNHELK